MWRKPSLEIIKVGAISTKQRVQSFQNLLDKAVVKGKNSVFLYSRYTSNLDNFCLESKRTCLPYIWMQVIVLQYGENSVRYGCRAFRKHYDQANLPELKFILLNILYMKVEFWSKLLDICCKECLKYYMVKEAILHEFCQVFRPITVKPKFNSLKNCFQAKLSAPTFSGAELFHRGQQLHGRRSTIFHNVSTFLQIC